jgi:hypothetical protein
MPSSIWGWWKSGLGFCPAAAAARTSGKNAVNSIPAHVKDVDLAKFFIPTFMNIATAKVSMSAAQARANGFLGPQDRIVFNRDLLIGEAKKEVLRMADAGYAPPAKKKLKVLGAAAEGMVNGELFNMQSAGMYRIRRLPGPADCHGGGRRRRPHQQRNRRGSDPEPRARSVHRLSETGKNPGPHRAHAEDGQTLAQLIRQPGRFILKEEPNMRDAYIVTSVRTPGCRRGKGAFKDTRPEDLLSFILKSAVEKTANLDFDKVDDLMIGCSFPEAEQGLNIGRIAGQIAGFPETVSGATVNRFCSSGLEAIALASLRVMAGWSDITIGGGVESMTYVPMGGNLPRPHPEYTRTQADLYASMGITAENVANRYDVSREAQDEFAYQFSDEGRRSPEKRGCTPKSYRHRPPNTF